MTTYLNVLNGRESHHQILIFLVCVCFVWILASKICKLNLIFSLCCGNFFVGQSKIA